MNSDELGRLQDLYDRAERNKKTSRRALIISIVAAAIALALLIGGLVAMGVARNNQDLLEGQKTSLHKINEIVNGLQQAETQRAKTSKGQAIALAVIVENLAAFAATPPYPDPQRKRAVDGLCATARQFRTAGGDNNPPACPAP